MKQTEIENCAVCDQGVAHDNQAAFYRVSVDQMILSFPAIQRQVGLEQVFGGGQAGAALAFHMGPQEDIALCASTSKGIVCQECWLTRSAGVVWEALGRKCSEEQPLQEE